MTIQDIFQSAVDFAASGDDRRAAEAYRQFLDEVDDLRLRLPESERQSLRRAATFNLGQTLNRLEDYEQARKLITTELLDGATPFGRAVALAVRGEALCGLGQMREGKAAFLQAAQAHTIAGRLNSAEAMARLGGDELLAIADGWVELVAGTFGDQLTPQFRAEIETIKGKIAMRRGESSVARRHFEQALRIAPGDSEAKLQLSRLENPR